MNDSPTPLDEPLTPQLKSSLKFSLLWGLLSVLLGLVLGMGSYFFLLFLHFSRAVQESDFAKIVLILPVVCHLLIFGFSLFYQRVLSKSQPTYLQVFANACLSFLSYDVFGSEIFMTLYLLPWLFPHDFLPSQWDYYINLEIIGIAGKIPITALQKLLLTAFCSILKSAIVVPLSWPFRKPR